MFNVGLVAIKKSRSPQRPKSGHGFPALVIHQTPEAKRESKFELSKEAVSLFGINMDGENLPYFAFFNGSDQEDTQYHGRLFIGMNENPSEEEKKYFVQLRKNGTFASKIYHEFVNSAYSWIDSANQDVVLELALTPNNNGIRIAEVFEHEEVPQDVDTQAQLVEENEWM